jgi:hypothetical protein
MLEGPSRRWEGCTRHPVQASPLPRTSGSSSHMGARAFGTDAPFPLYNWIFHPIWARAPSGRMHLSHRMGESVSWTDAPDPRTGPSFLLDTCTCPVGTVPASTGRMHRYRWFGVPIRGEDASISWGGYTRTMGRVHLSAMKGVPVRREEASVMAYRHRHPRGKMYPSRRRGHRSSLMDTGNPWEGWSRQPGHLWPCGLTDTGERREGCRRPDFASTDEA